MIGDTIEFRIFVSNAREWIVPLMPAIARLGLVGVGRWGRRYVETILSLAPEIQLVAFARRQMKDTTVIAGNDPIQYTYWEELVLSDLDGVIIATPPELHFPIASLAMMAGVPALIEKPLTLSLREAQGLLCIGSKVKTLSAMVGYTHLYSPAFRTLIDMVDDDEVIEIESIGGGPGPVRYYSALWDIAPHDLSMALSLVGNKSKNFVIERVVRSDFPEKGETTQVKLTINQIPMLMTISNALAERHRLFTVKTKSGRTLTYDDRSRTKLVVDGVPCPVGEERPLTRQVKTFAKVAASKIPTGTLDLESSVHIAEIIEAVKGWPNRA